MFKLATRAIILVGVGAFLYGVTQQSLPYWWKAPSSFSASKVIEKPAHAEEKPKQRLYSSIPDEGTEIGKLTIPRLGVQNVPIIQGSYENDLAIGAGHYDRSALPGEADNCVIGGHRDQFFRALKDIRVQDDILIETSAGRFTYRVTKTTVVDKNDRTIIVSTAPHPELRLVTCYPFTFIGPAPKRFIVFAELVHAEYHAKGGGLNEKTPSTVNEPNAV
jgi:sortase A